MSKRLDEIIKKVTEETLNSEKSFTILACKKEWSDEFKSMEKEVNKIREKFSEFESRKDLLWSTIKKDIGKYHIDLKYDKEKKYH